jgi:hypothetical protein
MKKRKIAIIAAIVLLLIVGMVWALSDSQVAKVRKLQKEAFPEGQEPNREKMGEFFREMRQLPPEQREQFIPPEQRERMQRMREMAEKDRQHMEDYFKLPANQRKQHLDKQIQEEEKRRKEWEQRRQEREKSQPPGSQGQGGQGQGQGRGPGWGQGMGGPPDGGPGMGGGPGPQGGPGAGQGGPRGGGRNQTPEQRAQRRNQFMDHTTPAARAKMAEYRDAMRKRRIELGLSPYPSRGPGRGR